MLPATLRLIQLYSSLYYTGLVSVLFKINNSRSCQKQLLKYRLSGIQLPNTVTHQLMAVYNRLFSIQSMPRTPYLWILMSHARFLNVYDFDSLEEKNYFYPKELLSVSNSLDALLFPLVAGGPHSRSARKYFQVDSSKGCFVVIA